MADNIANKVVREGLLSELAGNVDMPSMRRIARECMDIPNFAIDNIPYNPYNDHEAKFQLLMKWLRSQAPEPTVRDLLDILERAMEKGISVSTAAINLVKRQGKCKIINVIYDIYFIHFNV